MWGWGLFFYLFQKKILKKSKIITKLNWNGLILQTTIFLVKRVMKINKKHTIKMLFNFKKYQKTYSFCFTFFLVFVGLLGCGNGETSDKKSTAQQANNYKPKSIGSEGELALVISPKLKKDTAGLVLLEIFEQNFAGIAEPEPNFKVLQVVPSEFKKLMQRHNNLLIAMDFSDDSMEGQMIKTFFNASSLEKLRANPNTFMTIRSDVFAQGQKVMFLSAPNKAVFLENLLKNDANILEYFQKAERERALEKVIGDDGTLTQIELEKMIKKEIGLAGKIPQGYKVAFKELKKDTNFIWLRCPATAENPNYDKSLWITKLPYTQKSQFDTTQIIKLRNRIGEKYMSNKELKDSYMNTENTNLPIETRNFDRKDIGFSTEYRGMWVLKNRMRGGNFIGYAFAKGKDFYYIETFMYAPQQKKRRALVELDGLLRTFKP